MPEPRPGAPSSGRAPVMSGPHVAELGDRERLAAAQSGHCHLESPLLVDRLRDHAGFVADPAQRERGAIAGVGLVDDAGEQERPEVHGIGGRGNAAAT